MGPNGNITLSGKEIDGGIIKELKCKDFNSALIIDWRFFRNYHISMGITSIDQLRDYYLRKWSQ